MPRPPLLLAALALLLLNTFAVLSNRHLAISGDVDFRALYAAGILLRTQPTTLYDYEAEHRAQDSTISERQIALPYLYPPFAAIPFAPISLLPFRTAYLVFLLLNLAALLAATLLLKPSPQTLLLFLVFLPIAITLFQGQVSIFLLLALLAADRALETRKPYLAGLLLAVLLLKPQLALPIALLFLFWRAWPLLTGFLAGATVLILLSIAIAGPTTLRAYLQALVTATSGALSQYSVFSAPMPNLHGLALLLTGATHHTAAILVTLFLTVATFLYTALQPPSLSRAIVVALLVSYHLHLHDLTLLLLPISLTLYQSYPRRLTQATAFLWLLTPLHLLLMATGLNSLFVPLMLPFLSPSKEPAKLEVA